mmetsp:Transcript_17799/g.44144  ORF Transcript_17799/g.44144 Transcript_17799/m.44144 type:complete len:231 (-) Transcript_17799:564-1256(-)
MDTRRAPARLPPFTSLSAAYLLSPSSAAVLPACFLLYPPTSDSILRLSMRAVKSLSFSLSFTTMSTVRSIVFPLLSAPPPFRLRLRRTVRSSPSSLALCSVKSCTWLVKLLTILQRSSLSTPLYFPLPPPAWTSLPKNLCSFFKLSSSSLSPLPAFLATFSSAASSDLASASCSSLSCSSAICSLFSLTSADNSDLVRSTSSFSSLILLLFFFSSSTSSLSFSSSLSYRL